MELVDGPSLDKVLATLRELRDESGELRGGKKPSIHQSEACDLQSEIELTATADGCPTLADANSLSSVTGAAYFDTVARMMAEVANALAHAHEHGVIHRDIKPSNLLLSKDGQLSINDFGLARMLEQPGMTVTGEFMRSPLYMSPEQVTAEREPVDHRTDIYSLGATLYETLTLRPPFARNQKYSVLSRILHEKPVSPRLVRKQIPSDLETFCNKAMEKEPRRRYATAVKLAEDLHRFVNREAISARRIGPVGKSLRWCRRNPQISFLSGVLCLVMIVATAVFAWHRQASNQLQAFLRDDVPTTLALFKDGELVEALRRVSALPPDDSNRPEIMSVLGEFTFATIIDSDPVGATIAIRQQNRPNQEWLELGETPLVGVRLPNVDLQFRVSKSGHDDLVVLRTWVGAQRDVGFGFHLTRAGSAMVRVEGAQKRIPTNSVVSIPFIGHFHSLELDPFLIDRFEVTNGQFQEFVDA